MTHADPQYRTWLADLKERLRQSQLKAAIAVNTELLHFYWYLGGEIVRLQAQTSWGSGFLKQLSIDLTDEFKGVEGFSERNLKRVRQWYERYTLLIGPQAVAQLEEPSQPTSNQLQIADIQASAIGQQAVAQLPELLASVPWGHHTVILTKVKDADAARYYMEQTVRHGWSRNMLSIHIEQDEYGRRGKALTNFHLTLPDKDSDLEKETLKNPYNFDFLTLGPDAKERDIEQALVKEVGRLLLELGKGFAYVGRQTLMEVEGDVFFPDLIFFNYISNRFFVFELKAGKAKPEHLGQLNFYVQLINERLKTQKHQDTIGILLSRDANKKVMQTAINGYVTPIGQSDYKILEKLPEDVKGALPTMKEIEKELETVEDLAEKIRNVINDQKTESTTPALRKTKASAWADYNDNVKQILGEIERFINKEIGIIFQEVNYEFKVNRDMLTAPSIESLESELMKDFYDRNYATRKEHVQEAFPNPFKPKVTKLSITQLSNLEGHIKFVSIRKISFEHIDMNLSFDIKWDMYDIKLSTNYGVIHSWKYGDKFDQPTIKRLVSQLLEGVMSKLNQDIFKQ